jgi:hypothetical protein
MSNLSTRSIDTIRRLVVDLAQGQYAAIEADGRIGRLTSEELRRAIADYGRTVVVPPDDFIDAIDVHPISGTREYALDIPLWTAEEGLSDLTLSVTLTESEEVATVRIDDVHVL